MKQDGAASFPFICDSQDGALAAMHKGNLAAAHEVKGLSAESHLLKLTTGAFAGSHQLRNQQNICYKLQSLYLDSKTASV